MLHKHTKHKKIDTCIHMLHASCYKQCHILHPSISNQIKHVCLVQQIVGEPPLSKPTSGLLGTHLGAPKTQDEGDPRGRSIGLRRLCCVRCHRFSDPIQQEGSDVMLLLGVMGSDGILMVSSNIGQDLHPCDIFRTARSGSHVPQAPAKQRHRKHPE